MVYMNFLGLPGLAIVDSKFSSFAVLMIHSFSP